MPAHCHHCYAESSPKGSDGAMLPTDWCRVIDEVAQLGGLRVQFIGGEPTLYRGLPDLVHRALGQGLEVEVFSNLVHVSSELWETFARPGVRLATSYYSDDAAEHETITQGRGSHSRTRANIVEALRRSIPLRVGLVEVQDGQRVEQARTELGVLGVTEIGTDHLRQVGRGIRQCRPSIDQLCGHCARGKVAVSPNGDVWPCVFARWMPVGNVRQRALAEILAVRRAGVCRITAPAAQMTKTTRRLGACVRSTRLHPGCVAAQGLPSLALYCAMRR
ncbi:MAG: radical SAM/SPASM domain-containing protein [Pseudonocardiaceae bacterium]